MSRAADHRGFDSSIIGDGSKSVGSVLVDETTHRSVEGIFEWGEQRDLELKGKTEKVPAWIVAGVAAEVPMLAGAVDIATELPENVNSVLWIRRRKDTLAMGNITGAMVGGLFLGLVEVLSVGYLTSSYRDAVAFPLSRCRDARGARGVPRVPRRLV